MRGIAKPFIPWVGGKGRLEPYVRRVFPPSFNPFIEPFGGSGAILLGLPPNPSRLDIYNDYDSDLTNLFVCVRDHTLELIQELGFLPLHSRAEFEDLKRFLRREQIPEPEIEREIEIAHACFPPQEAAELEEILRGRAQMRDVRRAAAFYKTSRGSFSGTRSSFGVRPNNLRRFFYLLQDASVRLADVVIENRDGEKLIRERDSPTALIYCDPPYYEAERSYRMVFSKRAHVRLYHALHDCKGFVVVSYNDCPYIRNLYKDFFILAFRRANSLSQKQGAEYGELLITNYDPRPYLAHQLTLFDLETGDSGMELVHIPPKPLKLVS